MNVPSAIAGFAMASLFIYLLYAQPHTRPMAAAAAAAALTVAACKWAGAAGIAVPVAALAGVAAGLAAGALPRARRTHHGEPTHKRPATTATAAQAPTGEKGGPQ